MEEATSCILKRPTTFQDLPSDVSSLIFNHIDNASDLSSSSLACKLFHTLSSAQVQTLTLKERRSTYPLSYHEVSRLLKRFSSIKEIHVYYYRVNNALLAISHSNLHCLEKLNVWLIEDDMLPAMNVLLMSMANSKVIRSIKSLKPKCSSLFPFINMFPSLTELDLSACYQWKDAGIHEITSKLPNLQKINLGSNLKLTAKTLDILSSNCSKLESVNFNDCLFTIEAVYKFLCKNPQLRSVDLPGFMDVPFKITELVKCIHAIKYVNHISLVHNAVHDRALIALAESCPMLKSLKMCDDTCSNEYTMVGLSKLLYASPGLEMLFVQLPTLPFDDNCKNNQDKELSKIVKELPCLRHITVVSQVLCHDTLFSLVQNCPLLESICIKKDACFLAICIEWDEWLFDPNLVSIDVVGCPTKNYSIRCIEIIASVPLDVSRLLRREVKSCCPNLSTLNIHGSSFLVSCRN